MYLFAWQFWAQISSTVASAWNKSEGVYKVGSCTVGTESPEINLLVVVETAIVLLEGIHEYIATVTSEIEINSRILQEYHVSLNLINELTKKIKCKACEFNNSVIQEHEC